MAFPPIVSTQDLRELLATSADFILLDARPGAETFQAGHLAGAVHADLNLHLSTASDADFDPRRGGRHPLPPIDRWVHRLGMWGIGPATRVVIYDDADGANAAARAWWMLRSIGHTMAVVLDGGFRAALEDGLPLSIEAGPPRPREPYPADRWQWPTAGADAVDRLRRDAAWKVLDVRGAERFRGETEPIDPVAGHIPGAVNLPFAENLERGRFRNGPDLRARYEALLAGTPPQRLIVHCGSGVTACHTLLALELAGLPGASLYVGSWSEWCRNDLPQATA